MLKWQRVAVGLVLTLALLVTFGCAKAPEVAPEVPGAPEAEKTISVAILGSLTGPVRHIGYGAVSLSDYWTDLNEKGGIEYTDPVTGKTEHAMVKVLMGDHSWDAAKCISLYERFKAAGMQWFNCNGSVPTMGVFALAARDHIPGSSLNCTFTPAIYDIEEPYLMGCCSTMPEVHMGVLATIMKDYWKESRKPKIGIMAANVGSRRAYETPSAGNEYGCEQLGAEFIGIEFVSLTPVDTKIEWGRFAEKGADWVIMDHFTASAYRVMAHDVNELGLGKKGINLVYEWIDPDVMLAEPDLYDPEKYGANVVVMSFGWNGTQWEYDNYVDKTPGMKLAFDLCQKYHGVIPEEQGGWAYLYGIQDGLVAKRVLKDTLERVGYEKLTGEAIRETLFTAKNFDTGGLNPVFTPNPKFPETHEYWTLCELRDSHVIFDPEKGSFFESAPVWEKPEWNPSTPSDVYTNYMTPQPH